MVPRFPAQRDLRVSARLRSGAPLRGGDCSVCTSVSGGGRVWARVVTDACRDGPAGPAGSSGLSACVGAAPLPAAEPAGSRVSLLQGPRCADRETEAQGRAGLARPTLPGPTVLCEAFARLTFIFSLRKKIEIVQLIKFLN